MKRFPGDDPSQTLVDYALVLLLFATVAIISVILLGPSIGSFIEQAINYLSI